jgi:hypothetical protein
LNRKEADYSLRVRWRIALLPGTGPIISSIRGVRKVLNEVFDINFRERNFYICNESLTGFVVF